MSVLKATELYKTFHDPHTVEVLKGVSLEIEPGASVAISGRSGEGKTTLLHVLSALEPVDRGEVYLNGERLTPQRSAALRNRSIGFVFQAFNLLEDFSAIDNVLMPAKVARKTAPRSHGLELLAKVGLEHRADFPARLLSGGERQRVAVARALCNDPPLLFADEPSGNLDRQNAQNLATLLFDLVRKENKSLLLVTHDQDLSVQCDQRYLLSQGKLILQQISPLAETLRDC